MLIKMGGNSLLCIANTIIFIVCFSQCSESRHPKCLKNCWHSDSVNRHRLCRRYFCPEGCRAGWHGPTCNRMCSSNCKNSLCVQIDGKCDHGCLDGWTGNRCNRRCKGNLCKPPSCRSHFCDRADDRDCSEGYYGLQCKYRCSRKCASNKCKFSVKDARPECYKGCTGEHAGIFCKEHCPSRCMQCNQRDGRCNRCVKGYYGVRCVDQCPEYCDYGRCDMDGRCRINPYSSNGVSGRKVKRNTPDICLWRNDTVCVCCDSGHRGEQCEIICKNSETIIVSRTCHYLCKEGYYGTTCGNACPSTCAPGLSSKPLCREIRPGTVKCSNGCINGFYGQQCNLNCSSTCKNNTCYQTDGNCVFCDDAVYGPKCETACSSGCFNQHCHRNETCKKGCKYGFYGDDCRKDCPRNCAPGQPGFPVCEETTGGGVQCSLGCEAGHYGVMCSQKCSSRCLLNVCHRNGICSDGCEKGFYGYDCRKDCPRNCAPGQPGFPVCKETTGGGVQCSFGCDAGYYGVMCSQKCSSGCQLNVCHRNGTCSEGCEEGFYGDDCRKDCPRNCAPGQPGVPVCEETTGGGVQCSLGCDAGYYGVMCSQKCSIGCLLNVCHRNGTCIESCEEGFYGDDRRKICPHNCAPGPPGVPVCKESTGGGVQCSFGCDAGYYGVMCTQTCSSGCMLKRCHRNGTCLKGCKPGYYGRTCAAMCGDICLNEKCHQDIIHGKEIVFCTEGCADGYNGQKSTKCYDATMNIRLGVVFIVIIAAVILSFIGVLNVLRCSC